MKVCTIASGSSGNATYIEEEDSAVLVDAGLSGKAIVGALEDVTLDCSKLEGIFVTHEHTDHIKGVGVMARKLKLDVYATEETWYAMENSIGPIPEEKKQYITKGKEVECGKLKVQPFATSHDAANSVGYALYGKKSKVGIATDTGYLTDSAREGIQESDLLIFEANHDLKMLKEGSYPWHLKKRILSDLGHLSNIAAAHCLASLISGKTRNVVLAHLSQENNTPEVALSTIENTLGKSGTRRSDLKISVAPRTCPGTLWDLDKEG